MYIFELCTVRMCISGHYIHKTFIIHYKKSIKIENNSFTNILYTAHFLSIKMAGLFSGQSKISYGRHTLGRKFSHTFIFLSSDQGNRKLQPNFLYRIFTIRSTYKDSVTKSSINWKNIHL